MNYRGRISPQDIEVQSLDNLISHNQWSDLAYKAMHNKGISIDVMPEVLSLSPETFNALLDGKIVPDTVTQVSLLILAGVSVDKAVGRIISPALRLLAEHPSVDKKGDRFFPNAIRTWTNYATGDDRWEFPLVSIRENYKNALNCVIRQSRSPRTVKIDMHVYSIGELETQTLLEFSRRLHLAGFVNKVKAVIEEAKKAGRFRGLPGAARVHGDSLAQNYSDEYVYGSCSHMHFQIDKLPAVFADELFRYIFSEVQEHGTALPCRGLVGHDALRAIHKSAKYA